MFEFVTLLSAVVFVLLDSFYLNIMKNYLTKQIENVQGSKMKFNFIGAALCYAFLIIGLNHFIIQPNKSIQDAFLFGLIVYGVFETTNYAIFEKWSLFTVFIDTLWGGILFSLTVFIVQHIRKLFSRL
jgi:uncharacterized membrane protein